MQHVWKSVRKWHRSRCSSEYAYRGKAACRAVAQEPQTWREDSGWVAPQKENGLLRRTDNLSRFCCCWVAGTSHFHSSKLIANGGASKRNPASNSKAHLFSILEDFQKRQICSKWLRVKYLGIFQNPWGAGMVWDFGEHLTDVLRQYLG